MNLVVRPHTYRMIVLPNLMGDIVSDLCAGLVGGLGFAPSANIGTHISIFEAVHGTAPDIAGKGIANPTSLVLSGLMMLRHIGLVKQAALIENALLATLESGTHTGDFGDRSKPSVNTKQFTGAIIDRLGQKPTTVPAAPVPEDQDQITFQRPPTPASPRMIGSHRQVTTQVAGCDVYLETRLAPGALADQLAPLCQGLPFRLTLISNRGTQVWPTGSVYTECVDYFRARFEKADGASITQKECLALLARIGERFTIAEYDLLRTFDGARGYSLAQGQ
jgi:isocitrate dehydrogenase